MHRVVCVPSGDIGSVFDVLVEIADMASNFMPRLKRERYEGDEAECEPLPSADEPARHVAAVLALHHLILVALERVPKRMGPTGEEEEHGGGN